jgi:hypothetical protein
MRDRRALIAVVAFIGVIGVGLYLSSNSDPFDEATPTDTAVPAQTEPAESLDVSEAEQGNFRSEIERIISIENELFADPDPSRVNEIMLQGCDCFDQTRQRLEELDANNWRVDGDNIEIVNASAYLVEESMIEGVVNVAPAGKPVVDATGSVVEDSPSGSFQPLVFVLDKGQDGIWRVSERRLPEEVF